LVGLDPVVVGTLAAQDPALAMSVAHGLELVISVTLDPAAVVHAPVQTTSRRTSIDPKVIALR
jgi:hypothetical protein